MKIFLIAQLQKVFVFFFLFASLDASLNDGIVSQSIANNGREPIVDLFLTDKSSDVIKERGGAAIEATLNNNVSADENLALNSQRKSQVKSGRDRHRFVLPVVKLTTAHPEF